MLSSCDLCLRIIARDCINCQPPEKFATRSSQNLDEIFINHHNSYEISYIHTTISHEISGIILASRRDLCYTHTIHTGSRRVMYDDYDLDYTYTNDASYDLDGYTSDLDEDYARDAHDYESLAYRHYA